MNFEDNILNSMLIYCNTCGRILRMNDLKLQQHREFGFSSYCGETCIKKAIKVDH